MAKYGSPDLKIEVDNAGGTLVDLSAYIDDDIKLDIEGLMEELLAYSATWPVQVATGVKKASDINLGGMFDDTATVGPHTILNAVGSTRSVKITWGGSNTSTFEAVIKTYSRKASKGGMTRFEAVLTPTGAVT
jgi:hypothetical protein